MTDDIVRFGHSILGCEPLADVMVNEARHGLTRILPHLSGTDVLEVGAGHCILAAYLASRGYRVTALEPMGDEFRFFSDLQRKMIEHCERNGFPLTLRRSPGEQLDKPGQFDFAYTINALEHMREPLAVIDRMHASLRPGGAMLLHCPNYNVPFDSHFGVVLVTRNKRINRWLYGARLDSQPGVWNELNFIRYSDLKRHMDGRGWCYAFNATVADFAARLRSDPIFAARMPWFVRACPPRLADMWPVRWQSPMEVLAHAARVDCAPCGRS